MRIRLALAIVLICCLSAVAWAWAAPGHRVITRLALGLLPNDMPQWLREPAVIEQIAFESNEPDRWRGVALPALDHQNNPDHYIDSETLADHGLTLRTLPALRYEFIAAITKNAAATQPATQSAGRPARGVQRFVSDDVGTLPYAISEHYAKLVASFNTLRILESLQREQDGNQMAAARANVISEMGQLSHFVGDAGQPLHTTIHHHGWIGDNPNGYTRDRGFHAYIDVDIVALHALNEDALKPGLKPLPDIPRDGVWDAAIGLIERSFAQVEPLYRMQKSGDLQKDAGRKLIAERMRDSAEVLAGLYWRAWRQSEPTQRQIDDFLRFNEFQAERHWPATAPAKN